MAVVRKNAPLEQEHDGVVVVVVVIVVVVMVVVVLKLKVGDAIDAITPVHVSDGAQAGVEKGHGSSVQERCIRARA